MQLWYACKENQLLGPFQEGELHASLQSKQIGAHDWVRKAEDVDWKFASEINDFKNYFIDAVSDKLPFEENWYDKWVLLQMNPQTNAYSQMGPYSTKEILSKIYEGTAEYSDFVWQQGMGEWKRLGAVDAFIPKEEQKLEEAVMPAAEINRETIASQVIVNKPLQNSFYEQIPLFEEEAKFPLTARTAPRLTRPPDTFPEYYKPIVNKKKRWWIFSFLCLVLSLAIAIWGKNSLSLYL